MSAANSPTYQQGLLDGAEDCRIVAQCPPGMPLGPRPPYPAYPVMYNRGYDEAWSQAVPHLGCSRCRRKDSSEEE